MAGGAPIKRSGDSRLRGLKRMRAVERFQSDSSSWPHQGERVWLFYFSEGLLQVRRSASFRMPPTSKSGRLVDGEAAIGNELYALCMGRSHGGSRPNPRACWRGLLIVLNLSEDQARRGRSATDRLGVIGAGQILWRMPSTPATDCDKPYASRRMGQCETDAHSQEHSRLQPLPPPMAQSHKGGLQQTQTPPRDSHVFEEHDPSPLTPAD